MERESEKKRSIKEENRIKMKIQSFCTWRSHTCERTHSSMPCMCRRKIRGANYDAVTVM